VIDSATVEVKYGLNVELPAASSCTEVVSAVGLKGPAAVATSVATSAAQAWATFLAPKSAAVDLKVSVAVVTDSAIVEVKSFSFGQCEGSVAVGLNGPAAVMTDSAAVEVTSYSFGLCEGSAQECSPRKLWQRILSQESMQILRLMPQ